MSRDNKGFTLIELLLAMSFVSILLLAIAATVMQLASIYNRGLTLKDVNQTGDLIASDLKTTFNMSAPFDIESDYLPSYGRLCTGKYSYIWNYGTEIYDSKTTNKYSDSSDIIRLIKVNDIGGSYCSNTAKQIIKAESTELLDGGDHDLAIHVFNVSTNESAADTVTGQQLYSIDFLIGTNDQSALKYISDKAVCKLSNEDGADPAYCYVNQFNIVVRAGNTIN